MPRTGPSRAALELIDVLVDRPRARLREVGAAQTIATLHSIEKLGDPMIAPYLLLLVGAPPPSFSSAFPWSLRKLLGRPHRVADEAVSVSQLAGKIAAQLLMRASPTELVWLDRRLRGSWRWNFCVEWWQVEGLAAAEPASAVGLLGIACSHPDGRVREGAVLRLSERHGGDVLPFLLMRLDDWVPQVRERAVSSVHARLKPEYASIFLRCLPILALLSLRQRASETKLVDWIRRWLLDPRFSDELLEALRDGNRDVRLEALALCRESTSIPARKALEVALADEVFLVRLHASRLGAERLQGADARWFIEMLCKDPHAKLRTHGLDLLVALDGERARPKLQAALADRSEAVRSTARFHLRKTGGFDFPTYYRDALQSRAPQTLRLALAGLAECGEAETDLRRVEPLLGHLEGRVARAALEAIAALDKDVAHRTALELLREQRPGVARAAAAILRRHISDADSQGLWRAVVEAPLPRARLRALQLLRGCSWWVRFPCFARAVALKDEEVRDAASHELARWLWAYKLGPYAPPRPTPVQLDECRAALATASEALAPDLRSSLGEVLEAVQAR